MSEDEMDFKPDVDETDLDRAVSASYLVLSAIPTIGPLIGEAVKHGIPNQRIDRIAHMLKILDGQLITLQKDFLDQKMRTEEFRDLLEDGLLQTTRARSDERRAHIAALLKNSITGEELSHEQEKTLLELLGRLNDPELLILGWYGTNMVGELADEYFRRHGDVLMAPIFESMMSDEEERENILKERYRDNLRNLGLTRLNRRGRDEIAPLGRLLLRQIDFYSIQGPEESSLASAP